MRQLLRLAGIVRKRIHIIKHVKLVFKRRILKLVVLKLGQTIRNLMKENGGSIIFDSSVSKFYAIRKLIYSRSESKLKLIKLFSPAFNRRGKKQ